MPFFMEFMLPLLARGKVLKPKSWPVLKAAATVVAPLSGFIVLGVVSATTTGSGTSFLTVQENWGRSYRLWNLASALGSGLSYAGPPADLIGVVFGVAMLPFLWKRLPASVSAFGTAMVAIGSQPRSTSMPRCVEHTPK